MAVKPVYDDFCFCWDKTVSHDLSVECKFNANNINNVVAVSGHAAAVSDELYEGGVRFSGRAVFSVLFENEGGELKKTECGVEFSDRVDAPDNAACVKNLIYEVRDVHVNEINGAYSVTATVKAHLLINCNRTVKAVVEGEDMLCDPSSAELYSMVECKKSVLQTDEEFDLPYVIKDILFHRASVCVNDVQSGINEIILEGNVNLSFTALQNGEKNAILKETRSVPFRHEIEFAQASPDMKAFVDAEVVKSSFKVVVDEEKNSSSVVFNCDIGASGCVYDGRTASFARDAYSVKNQLFLSEDSAFYSVPCESFSSNERIIGATDLQPEGDIEIVAVIAENVEGISLSDDCQKLLGVLAATVILKDANGRLFSKEACLPFEMPFNGNIGKHYAYSVVIESFNYRIRSSVEFEALLRVIVTEYAENRCSFISDIEIGEEKEDCGSAISIYMAAANDTLWDVCKRLGVSADTVRELNPDVSFPLGGSERLIVYRSL